MTEERLSEISTVHVLEHYKNHCRFLGYSIEEMDESSIMCRHPRKDSIQVDHLKHCAGVSVNLIQRFPKYAEYNFPLLFEYVNHLNSQFIFLKAFVLDEDDGLPPMIHLSSVCEGEYNQKIFSIFMDNFECDFEVYKYHPKTIELWEPENR